jgi:hypothetical protein
MNRAMVFAQGTANLMQRLSRLPTTPDLGLLHRRKTIPSSWSHEHHLLKTNDLYQMVLHPPVELARVIGNFGQMTAPAAALLDRCKIESRSTPK